MSIRLMNETMDTGLSVSSKMVMMVLCDFADDGGRNCWPAIATIAAKASLSERQTQRVMGELKQAQLIAVIGNTATGGRNTTCRYAINVQKLAAMAADERSKREMALAQKGDKLSPFTDVDNSAKGDIHVTLIDAERVTSETERVTSATSKGDTHVTQSVINHQQAVRGAGAHEVVDNLQADAPTESGEVQTLREFPIDWQPCETCRSVLKVRNIDWPDRNVADAFAAHWAGKWIEPRRIPNEFMKWVARQRGMDARFGSASTAKKSVSEEASKAWEEVRAANKFNAYPKGGWTDSRTGPALDAIGGFYSLADMKTSDVPFRQRDFISAFSIGRKPHERRPG